MAWTHLQGTGTNSASAASIGVAFTSNLSSGSKLIAWVATNAASATTGTTSVSDGTNAFSSLGSTTFATDHMSLSLWVLDTPAGDVGTKPTITAQCSGTGTSAGLAIAIQEVSGLATGVTTAILDTAAIVFSTSATPGTSEVVPSLTTTASNEYLMQVYSDPGTSSTVALSGYSGLDGSNDNGNAEDVIGWKNSTHAAETGTWTGLNNNPTVLAAAAIKLPAAGTTTVTPVHIVQRFPLRRRGFLQFLRGPVNPVPVPKIDKVQRFPLRLRGVSKFLKGPITPVPQVPVVVQNTHRRRTGKIVYLRGPVNPVPEPNILVQNTHRRRRGVIQYLRGNVPAAVVPTPPVNVIPFPRARRRGTVKVLAGPVNPVPQVPVVVVAAHRVRRGRALFLVGPITPVPVGPVTVENTHRRRLGRLIYLRGTVPTGPAPVPVPPVNVIPIARARRRGHVQFLAGPVNPVAAPPVTVRNTHRVRRGNVVYLRGTAPSVVPVPLPNVTVRTFAIRRRGRLAYLRGTAPAVVIPVPPVTVVSTHRLRRGISKFLRGPVNPVPEPNVKVVQLYPPKRRGILRYLRGLVPPPPVFGVGRLTAVDTVENTITVVESGALAGSAAFGGGLFGVGYFGVGAGTIAVVTVGEDRPLAGFSIYGSGMYGSGSYGVGGTVGSIAAGEDIPLTDVYGTGTYGDGTYGATGGHVGRLTASDRPLNIVTEGDI